ncbi:oxidoreductase domain containing protein [Caldicellulosiruptor saccharolyticus DSM 8903]|uniref:Oxidoreductase domain containing protein n=1 Tax=Caldicellulosiruptor saccharolyticus (strain ATCC 43494 / DSM 8903 / Tp8T 6331) TaxID=351627 RepID=A4XGK1_CALS8|nr:Gfo/Idh/MocA family oxidoreductase [Caldicellulosiruptor saccharolyticus]ABP66036.1 oxidoreductase domain containing protein [Caldicellulosiruptor saccharolyticus DSM 8903]
MKKIKAGVIGTGFIGPAHIEGLRRLGFVDVVALADINEEVAKQKAELLSIEKYYGDYKDLLNDKDIQVVHICTPNYLHYKIAKEALLAGKHVICEKPLAMSSSEGEELVRIAKEKGLVNAVHFNLRFYPLMHHLKKMIEKGELGKIFAINGSYQQDWLLYETDFNWRLLPEFSGESRAVADIGSHWLDLIEFVTELKVVEVYADFATFYPVRKKPLNPIETYAGKLMSAEDYEDVKITTEDYATVILKFNNGAHGSMTVNQVAAGRKNRLYFEIYGSKKGVSWNSERPNELWIGRRDGSNEILMKDPSLLDAYAREITSYPGGHNEGFPDTIKQMFKKVYTYILEEKYLRGEKPDFPTFEDGYREMLICEAIVKSAKNGCWVMVND